MNRADDEALDDIAAAISAIHSHLEHGPIAIEIVMDAVAMRLLEIGEAVKSLSDRVTATEPAIPWRAIAGMRDYLAHHYFGTTPEVIQSVIDKDLQPLSEAVARMRSRISDDGDS